MSQMTAIEPEEESGERFKRVVAVLIALVTLFAAIVAYLQREAGALDDAANRDNKRYALESFGRQVSGDARVNYDYNTAYQSWQELELLARSAESRGDEAVAKRYSTLRDRTLELSPLLADPYFDASTGEVNLELYEADVYLVELTALQENFLASSVVKDAWDAKSNTYIVHLTLLAVSLFLFGLSLVVSTGFTRWLLASAGTGITIVALVWAGATFTKPVVDLRTRGTAIDAYARGAGFAHQSKWEESLAAYNEALQSAPDYANALAARADVQMALGNYAAAATDLEQARAAGDQSANVTGQLAWTYHLLGRFGDAVDMNRIALKASPDELWVQYDLALSLLAAGRVDEAKAEYTVGMNMATQQVAAAKVAGAEPPSYLWWGLDDAADGLDELAYVLDGGEGVPGKDVIINPDTVRPAADEILNQLKSLSVALEYHGQPPTGTLSAEISSFAFGQPIYDEGGEVTDYTPADAVPYGTQEVGVLFDFAKMQNGQEVVFKVYVDGTEDPSWRLIAPWAAGESGIFEQPISLSYSENYVLAAGEYVVEMYVDSHLAQRGLFVVEAEQ